MKKQMENLVTNDMHLIQQHFLACLGKVRYLPTVAHQGGHLARFNQPHLGTWSGRGTFCLNDRLLPISLFRRKNMRNKSFYIQMY